MPNWTYNSIRVRATKLEDAAAFLNKYFVKDDMNQEQFDFDKVIPEPRKIEDCPKDCLVGKDSYIQILSDRPWFDWYAWHNKYWGCKWNASSTYIYKSDDGLTIDVDFATPWCAPYPIFKELKRQNPNLRIRVESENE